jgi:hypothetical protein
MFGTYRCDPVTHAITKLTDDEVLSQGCLLMRVAQTFVSSITAGEPSEPEVAVDRNTELGSMLIRFTHRGPPCTNSATHPAY